MTLIRIIIWFLVFYTLFKLLFRFVFPSLIKGFIRSRLKDMQQPPNTFDNTERPANPSQYSTSKKDATTATQGDYIDFEEVK